MARTSLTLVLLAITGAMALALGLVGIYGVISYVLTQRTREIGIRMALGAQSAALKRMLLGQVLAARRRWCRCSVSGGAALLTRLMESLLFGVTALDPDDLRRRCRRARSSRGRSPAICRRGALRASIRCWRSERNSPIQ